MKRSGIPRLLALLFLFVGLLVPDAAGIHNVAHAAPSPPVPPAAVTLIGSVQGNFFANLNNSGAFDIAAGTRPDFTASFQGINFNPPDGSGLQSLCNNSISGINPDHRPFTDVVPTSSGTCSLVAAQNSAGSVQAGLGTLNHRSSYQYDGDQNLTQATDARSNVTQYTYDLDNELSTLTRADNTFTTTWGYNGDLELTSSADTVGSATTSSTLGYDPAWELTSLVAKQGGTTTRNLTLAYNADGDRTGQSDSISGASASFGYDQADRLASYASGGTSAGYAYDGDGLRAKKTVNGAAEGFAYDLAEGLPLEQNHRGTENAERTEGRIVIRRLVTALVVPGSVARRAPFCGLRVLLCLCDSPCRRNLILQARSTQGCTLPARAVHRTQPVVGPGACDTWVVPGSYRRSVSTRSGWPTITSCAMPRNRP